MNCIFCKIIQNEIPSRKIYEDEHTLVFMDIANDVDGHMLAVTKKHVKNILDCEPETLTHLMHTVQLVSKHCIECGYDGVNLLNANGESAGQSASHFHIHIIPRKHQDGIDAWPHFSGSTTNIDQLHELLKM